MITSAPSRATVSELEAYARCPMEYFLKYNREVPAQLVSTAPLTELPGNILGDIVHAVIRGRLESPSTRIAELIDHHATSHDIPHALIPLEDIEPLCMRAIDFHHQHQWQEWRAEVPFAIQVNATLVHGTIDFLGRDTKGWHIVDYKTDRLATAADMPERAKSYQLQMMAYAAAANRAGMAPLMDTTLLFLRIEDQVTQKIMPQDTETALARIAAIIENIRQKKWDTDRTPPCRQCPYHHNQMCWEDRLR
jgi:ATP-dependent helicase/DNAse subunit B